MSAMKTKHAILVLGVLLSACASNDATRVEDDFGKSVRNMIDAQIYDPVAARNPPSEPPTTLDGGYAEQVLEAYRQDVPAPEETRRPIRIEIAE